MATAATISIKLDAQTAMLQRGFANAEKSVKGFRTSVETMASRFAKVTAAIAVATAALNRMRAAAQKMQEVISETANIADFADRIGANVERLQALHAVAEQFGASADVVNTSLQRMARRAAEAATKGGEVAAAMEAAGISVEQFAQLSRTQQVFRLADAVAATSDEGQQMALIMKLMDTEGVALAETLRLGSSALREQMEAMKATNVVAESHVRAMQESDAVVKQYTQSLKTLSTTVIAEAIIQLKALGTWIGENYTAQIMYLDNLYTGLQQTRAASLQTFDVADTLSEVPKHIEPVAESMKKAEDSAVRITSEVRKWTETPGVGAVTSGTSAGFSAAQTGRRRAQDRQKYEGEMLELNREIARLLAERDEFVPVTL